jgi:molecular chaperone HscA
MNAVERLRAARQTADTALLIVAIDALSAATEDFAARRMNASIAQALTGKTLEEL